MLANLVLRWGKNDEIKRGGIDSYFTRYYFVEQLRVQIDGKLIVR